MIDVKQFFHKTLVAKEIRGGLTPLIAFVKNSSNNEFNNPNFPESLNKLYGQVDLINIEWQIAQDDERGEKIVDRLKQDPWLKENYLQEGYSPGMLDEYFSGLINIQKVEDILNPEFCKEQGYYSVIESFVDGENADDYIPFDIHWSLTACLKRENGKIVDNIWIVYMDGESMFNMGVTIEKYLELCYKAKGFYYWPLVYYMRDSEHKEEDKHTQLMKHALQLIFPHVELDLSEFGIEG